MAEGRRKEVLLLRGERRSQSKKPDRLSRGPFYPFYQTRGAGYINRM
jgi:hypothetical protein